MVDPIPANQTRVVSPEQTDPGTIAGIVIVIILGGIILFIVVYCKFYRKFKRMKTEMAHVHYIADPSVQPGKILLFFFFENYLIFFFREKLAIFFLDVLY